MNKLIVGMLAALTFSASCYAAAPYNMQQAAVPVQMTIDASTGAPITMPKAEGPEMTLQTCVDLQMARKIEKPVNGQVIVHACAVEAGKNTISGYGPTGLHSTDKNEGSQITQMMELRVCQEVVAVLQETKDGDIQIFRKDVQRYNGHLDWFNSLVDRLDRALQAEVNGVSELALRSDCIGI